MKPFRSPPADGICPPLTPRGAPGLPYISALTAPRITVLWVLVLCRVSLSARAVLDWGLSTSHGVSHRIGIAFNKCHSFEISVEIKRNAFFFFFFQESKCMAFIHFQHIKDVFNTERPFTGLT